MTCLEKEQLLLAALEESQSLFAAMLHEDREKCEIEEQMVQNCTAIEAARCTPAAPVPKGLFEAIEHGDEKHRAWLKAALTAFFAGKPVPREVAAAPQQPDATVNDSLTVEAAPVQLPEPVAKIERGGLKWHIPDIRYSLPVCYSQGTHKLYSEQQVRDILAQYGIN